MQVHTRKTCPQFIDGSLDGLLGLQLLYRYNKEAVALRIAYLNSRPTGGESHSVIVRDIPGPAYGTLPNRMKNTALRFLPSFVKQRLLVRPADMLTDCLSLLVACLMQIQNSYTA